jgi:aspartate racemase
VKTLGILGGVGPLAGVHFYEQLVRRTPARTDQEHLPVVLMSSPEVTNRVEHLLGAGRSPAPALCAVARRLENAGAGLIVIASATTHAYHAEIQEAVTIPVLNLLEETAAALDRAGYRRPAFLATRATADLRLYDSYLAPGTEPIYPDPASQRELQALIDAVKAGAPKAALRQRSSAVLARRWAARADAAVLACTEVPLVAPVPPSGLPLVSVSDVLAEAALRECRTLAYT